jgi:hypothetical protein
LAAEPLPGNGAAGSGRHGRPSAYLLSDTRTPGFSPFVAERATAEIPSFKPLLDGPNRNRAESYIAQGATAPRRAPAVENENSVTAEVLAVEAVHSAELNILPPQVFLRVRLRLLTVDTPPGMSNFLVSPENASLDAYTREQITPDLVGTTIRCRLRYRGDERGGLYWMHDLRPLPTQ